MPPDRFLEIANCFSEAVLLLSAEGVIRAANRASARIGLPADLVGRHLSDLTATPADEVDRYMRACSRSKEPVVGALGFRTTDGDEIRCRCDGSVIHHDPDRSKTRLLLKVTRRELSLVQFGALNQKIEALTEEIHRRRNLEAELRDQRELLQVTLGSIGDAVITTDDQSRVTFLNGLAESLTGWTNADACGRPLAEVFPIVNESSRQPVDDPVAKVLREGAVVGLANHTVLIAKDGTERPVDDSAAPIRNDQGRLVGVVLVFRDVAERREAQRQLERSEAQLRLLANSIPQLAWMARPDGSIYWYNQRWYDYTGATPEAVQGWGWQSVHDPHELPRVLERFQRSLETGEPWEDTFPLRRHDGAMRWHLSRALPVRDEHGRIVRWFGTNTDITDRLELERELQEASRRKDEFLAMLGHELRNPLAAIKNGMELLQLAGVDESVQQTTRQIVSQQTDHMIRLVDDLLDVSRIMRGQIAIRREPVVLQEIIQDGIGITSAALEERRCELQTTLPDEPIRLHGDRVRLTQVVGNLLNNAAKYSQGCRIEISAECWDGEAVVRVRDYGMGIEPELLDRIFDLFVQSERSLDRAEGGLGIGLTVVRSLVQLHGGRIEVHSGGEGQGSEFTVRLPIAESRT